MTVLILMDSPLFYFNIINYSDSFIVVLRKGYKLIELS